MVIFYILDITLNVSDLDTLGQSFLIVSLPLSSIWASQENEAVQRRGITTTSSSAPVHSSPSSQFFRRFQFFNKTSKDNTHASHRDLEKAPNFSEAEGTKETGNSVASA
jgi:hypothetical protein